MTSSRNHFIDNTKAILIFFVVLGHALNPYIQDSRSFKALFDWLYTFHMPLFIFISGMFSRKESFKGSLKKNAINLLLPLLIFQFLYESLDLLARGKPSSYTMNLQPYWILWYLWSLFLWREFLNLIPVTTKTLIMTLSGVLIYNCTVNSAVPFGINRTLGFLPIFLLGHAYGTQIVSFSRKIDIRIAALTLTTVLFLLYWDTNFNSSILFHSETFRFLYNNPYSALFEQFFSYALAAITSVMILRLIPEKESLISTGGRYTLFIYLWHGFFIRALGVTGISAAIFDYFGPNASLVPFIAISIIITAALGIPAVSRYSQIMVTRIGRTLRIIE